MSEIFRLYGGVVVEGKWYNHASLKELRGGALAVLDGTERTGVSRLINLIRGTLGKLHTESGEVLDVEEQMIPHIFVQDAWKISREAQRDLFLTDKPTFPEHFYCSRCSRAGLERYTDVEENWQELIDDGFVDETYLESPDFLWKTILPRGIELPAKAPFKGGVYRVIWRSPLTLGELNRVVAIPSVTDSEANMICATWDAQIKDIEGISKKEYNILFRNPRDSFTKRYLVFAEDVEAMRAADEEMLFGLSANNRMVSCKYCGAEVGGYLDFTNFFDFLSPKKSSRNIGRNLK